MLNFFQPASAIDYAFEGSVLQESGLLLGHNHLPYSSRMNFINHGRHPGLAGFHNGTSSTETNLLYQPVTVNAGCNFDNGQRPNSIPGTGMAVRLGRDSSSSSETRVHSDQSTHKAPQPSNGIYDPVPSFNGLDRSDSGAFLHPFSSSIDDMRKTLLQGGGQPIKEGHYSWTRCTCWQEAQRICRLNARGLKRTLN
ncbi:hypothetical protein Ciccas_007451 [Cichlidogyrus casuarinus]|uniref:Uncharacterized protein n=1 Tax=Cichlidogyrus casuarinus TaxID=1844966 RepID=A0ABD2Q411_9PLAT